MHILTSQSHQGHIRVMQHKLEYAWIAGDVRLPTLVLLHEGLGCVAMWRDFPQRLAARTGCGVFVFSRAGYGRSSGVTLPRPTRYMHDEGLVVLPHLLAAAGIADCVLIGHSDGASISIIYAGGVTENPARGVVLLAPHVFNEAISVDSIASIRQAYQQTELRTALTRHHGAQVDTAFFGWNDVWLSEPFRQWNIEEYLSNIEVPVLLLQGCNDEYGTVAQLQAIEQAVSADVRTVMLDNCGHAPHRDCPADTLDEIDGMLATVLKSDP